MIRRPPRSTQSRSSAASDVYKRQRSTGPRRWAERILGRDPVHVGLAGRYAHLDSPAHAEPQQAGPAQPAAAQRVRANQGGRISPLAPRGLGPGPIYVRPIVAGPWTERSLTFPSRSSQAGTRLCTVPSSLTKRDEGGRKRGPRDRGAALEQALDGSGVRAI